MNADPPVRVHEKPERLDSMTAWRATCRYCGGDVSMSRDLDTLDLLPDHCRCLLCGQLYFMEIADIGAFELRQWKEKAAR